MRFSGRSGFSLMEMLIALAIGMLIAGGVTSILLSQTQLTATNNRNIINQQALRDTLQFLTDEVQLMGSSGVVEPYIAIADNQEFEFVADINGDGDPDRMRYFVSDNQLMREYAFSNDGGATWTILSTDELMPNVDTIAFTYYEPSNVVTAVLDDITSLEIQLSIQEDSEGTTYTTGKVADQQMIARVTIRNRQD